jgi:AcrR family transcriptional regulator
VGVDTIIAEAGVAKMTFYRHFPSKADLVLAFLQRRERLWSQMWLEAEVLHRAAAPAQRLLAIFEVFDEWFRRDAPNDPGESLCGLRGSRTAPFAVPR